MPPIHIRIEYTKSVLWRWQVGVVLISYYEHHSRARVIVPSCEVEAGTAETQQQWTFIDYFLPFNDGREREENDWDQNKSNKFSSESGAQRWWKGVNVNSIGLCREQIWKLSGTFELNSAVLQAFRLRTFGNKSSQSCAPTQYWCLPNTTPKFLGSLIKMKYITTSFLPK